MSDRTEPGRGNLDLVNSFKFLKMEGTKSGGNNYSQGTGGIGNIYSQGTGDVGITRAEGRRCAE